MRLLFIFILFTTFSLQSQCIDSVLCEKNCFCDNNTTPAGVMVSHVDQKNEWMFSYKFMGMTMGGIETGTLGNNSDNKGYANYEMLPSAMRMDMHMIMLMYGITDKLTLMAMANYNVNTMSMQIVNDTTNQASHNHVHHQNTNEHLQKNSGLGDIKLSALYALVKNKNHMFILCGGISLPTGKINQTVITGSSINRLAYNMQNGSGTYDFLPCVNYLFQKNKFSFSLQGSGVIRTNYNTLGYKFGNEVTINSWVAHQWSEFLSTSFRMEANYCERIAGNDSGLNPFSEPAANSVNYGGKRISAYVGLVLHPQKEIMKKNSFGFEYGIPVYQNLNGVCL